MEKILIVDDEKSISDLLQMLLIRENYIVDVAETGRLALEKIKSFKPDIVLLDLMLPDMSGYDICKEINHSNIPIIMLTAKNQIIDKVVGLESGADDYITKPFDNMELLARIKAILRRFNNIYGKENIISYRDLHINIDNKTVIKGEINISLTQKEYSILEIMAQNPKKVFSREELLLSVWGYDYLGDSRAVDISITRLRKKIEDDCDKPKYIITIFGFGYRFGGA